MSKLLFPLMMVIVMTAQAAPTKPHTPKPGTAERTAILDAARVPAEKELGKPVQLTVETLNVEGDWAFLHSVMDGPDTPPFNYGGTQFEEAARLGYKSGYFDALLKREGTTWQAVAYSIGPTGVPWVGWDKEYGAPSNLFPNLRGSGSGAGQ